METASHQMDNESVKDVSVNSVHHGYMREALNMVHHCLRERYTIFTPAQAEQALLSNETPVGCVFVRDGKVIGRGMNDTNRSLNVGKFKQTCIDNKQYFNDIYAVTNQRQRGLAMQSFWLLRR